MRLYAGLITDEECWRTINKLIQLSRCSASVLNIHLRVSQSGNIVYTDHELQQYACRPTRPKDTPRLRGMYVFGVRGNKNPTPKSDTKLRRRARSVSQAFGVLALDGAQIGASWNQKSQGVLNTSLLSHGHKWYQPAGWMIRKSEYLADWAETIKACEGIIAFDAVLCRGPRHDIATFSTERLHNPGTNESWLPPAIATIALGPTGCAECKSTIEGPACYGKSPSEHLPLLTPPPLHSFTANAAQKPTIDAGSSFPPLFVRCAECLTGRWCERCFKWWDEKCYPAALTGRRSSEVRNAAAALDQRRQENQKKSQDVRVFLGLCIESCLVSEEMNGSGSGGMWG